MTISLRRYGAIILASVLPIIAMGGCAAPLAMSAATLPMEAPVAAAIPAPETTREPSTYLAPIHAYTPPVEVEPLLLTLEGPLAQRSAQVSGMAWMSDTLVLLPQYPNFAGGDPVLYTIAKETILQAISGEIESIQPMTLPIALNGVPSATVGYEGFEAIAFAGSEFWLTAEATSNQTEGWLFHGSVLDGGASLSIDAASKQWVEPQTGRGNYSDESIVLTEDGLFTLYEANGAGMNPGAVAHTFDREAQPTGTLPLDAVEFRVTDATSLDEEDRFWVTNFFFPGDTWLETDNDPIANRWGEGATHATMDQVERLVEMQYAPEGITLVDRAPIQLKLALFSRNWEGVVRLDEMGFLIVTDQFPETLLAFVAVEVEP